MEINNNDFNLDDLIHGKVQPHIYAFRTNTIPDYLKVGDTYRPVSVRLTEWRAIYENLTQEYDREAVIEDSYFRDYSVHDFLERVKNKHRLTPEELNQIQKGLYYSKEFFKDATKNDIKEAIEEIIKDYKEKTGRYKFYSVYDKETQNSDYPRSETEWIPRPNQQEVIDNFNTAVKNGRTNLLMYAVMRFGKSFASLCCAKEMNAKLVLVVSAKADVQDEWKQNVQIPKNFEGFDFLISDRLKNEDELTKKLDDENIKCVVVFLTLQDLQGELLKEKHKELFAKKIDLMIIDESHFGARAQSFGKVIRESINETDSVKENEKQLKSLEKNDEEIEIDDAEKQIKEIEKQLNVKIKLHLSGTPYRILMGSEFSKEDIIGFCQFTDIVKEQEQWDKENNAKDEPCDEWENPYYGFPQMIRFAFNPSEAAQKKLEALKQNGKSASLSHLFYPKFINKDTDGNYKEFENQEEVLDLLKIIDGSKADSNILGFLDYEKLKKGEMCTHMVMVLPYCASCDAMQELIEQNKTLFKNLNQYKIINISGVDSPKKYKKIKDIKAEISECAKNKQKTLTLTVNRMLTGTTVKEWDTMIFLKDSSSAQDYDQSIFRLQNQYVTTFKSDDDKTIKFNNKPQTLLVDFDPNRMFVMQEQKSLIYNANTDVSGNANLENRIKEELRISPIITMNCGKIAQINPVDIMQAVSEYSSSRGVAEETNDIPVDANLQNFAEIFKEIERQNELGSKDGFNIKAADGKGDDLEIAEDSESKKVDSIQEESVKNLDKEKPDEDNSFENKFKAYYARILFFAYLTEDKIISLQELINVCKKNEENKRILKNLDLKINVLQLINEKIDKFILSQLDYKIQHINTLSTDEKVEPLERALIALKKFGRLGTSEVITPQNICEDMINLLPDECLQNALNQNRAIIDINSKTAEFAIALYKRYVEKLNKNVTELEKHIYSIPSSKITYEFTRKIYKILGLNIDCIAKNFVSYDLLKVKNAKNEIDYDKINLLLKQNKPFSEIKLDDEPTGESKMKIQAVVGNPPYQEMDGGAGASARPVYNNFVDCSKTLSNNCITMIMPSRWYAGGKGLDSFREKMLNDIHVETLHDFYKPELLFPDTNIRGGLCYFLRNNKYDNTKKLTTVVSHNSEGEFSNVKRNLKTEGTDIFIRSSISISIIQRIKELEFISFENYVSSRKPFGLDTTFINNEEFHKKKEDLTKPIKCYGKGWTIGFVEENLITQNKEYINQWKIFTSRANNIGTELNDDNLVTTIGEPKTICTESYLFFGINLKLNKETANNLKKYCTTKFFRFMHSLAKASQDATSKTYKFVPLQDFTAASDINWSTSIPDIDDQLYKKYKLEPEEIDFIEKMIRPMP